MTIRTLILIGGLVGLWASSAFADVSVVIDSGQASVEASAGVHICKRPPGDLVLNPILSDECTAIGQPGNSAFANYGFSLTTTPPSGAADSATLRVRTASNATGDGVSGVSVFMTGRIIVTGEAANTSLQFTDTLTDDEVNVRFYLIDLGPLGSFCTGTCSPEQNSFVSLGTLVVGSHPIAVQVVITTSGGESADRDLLVTLNFNADPVTEMHWISPAGGAFGDDFNWDPQQVPAFNADRSDTAIFDLPGSSPVPVLSQNNAVGRLVVRNMNVDLNGPLSAHGVADNVSFEVDDGGTLVLDNGVTLQTANAIVGNQSGGESSVFVSGPNTRWTSTGPDGVDIGDDAPGKVVVDQDGTLDAKIAVGSPAAGTLRVESGGQVSAPNLAVFNGSVQVRGRGAAASKVAINELLDVGATQGSASVLIEAGGQIKANAVFVGVDASTGSDTLTISGLDDLGNPSSLDVSGDDAELSVAGEAATQVEVKDGGLLTVLGASFVGKGLNEGRILVRGKSGNTHANFTTFGDLKIGSQIVASELFVEDGGRVSSTGLLEVGANSSEVGHATVSGSDAILSSDTLRVGKDGQGNLTISGGATVITRQNATVGASTQAISIVPPPTSGGTGAGVVTIIGDPFSASLWHVNGDCTVGVDEPGSITLSGTPFLGGPTLRVDARLDNGIHGIIAGNGTLAAVSIVNAGFISPGLSPGAMTIEGNLEQKPEGTLSLEIAGVAEGQFDILNVSGDAILDGTLLIGFIDGFVPQPGDTLPIIQIAGNVEGQFAQIETEGLPEGTSLAVDPLAGTVTVQSDTRAVRFCGACGAGTTALLPLGLLGLARLRYRRPRPPRGDRGPVSVNNPQPDQR